MKTKIFSLLAVGMISVVITGCVSTPAGEHTFGVPLVKDKVVGRYERSVDQVYNAAKEVIQFNGTIIRESTLHTTTNLIKVVEGKINQRTVWCGIEPVDAKVTAVTVQTRTQGGLSDLDLAHEIEKQIALKLVR